MDAAAVDEDARIDQIYKEATLPQRLVVIRSNLSCSFMLSKIYKLWALPVVSP